MRLAVLSDIHGNLGALEAALEDIETQNVDEIVVAGDVVNGLADSKRCWDLVMSLGCPVLRGNHERYLFDYATPAADPTWSSERFASLGWSLGQVTESDLETMRALPLAHRLPGLLIVHATPRSDQENVVAATTDADLERMFDVAETFIVRGHNHKWLERSWSGRRLVSMGSLGLPLNGRREAQYLVLEQRADGWKWHKRFVPYDVEATLKHLDSSGYLEAGGPMARLFRQELATAEGHFIPFLQKYLAAVDRGELTLQEAVDKFLA